MSFIFGGNTGMTYDQVQQKRRVAEQLMAANSGTPRNVGEGLSAIGRALAARAIEKRTDAADAKNRSAFDAKWGELLGGTSTPAGGISGPVPVADPNSPGVIAGDAMKALGKDPASVIRAGLIQRGLPEHVADGFLMNLQDESGLDPAINEKSPIVPGSRGGFGLAQWTGPRRVALEQFAASRGVPPSDLNAQLDFLVTELQGPEAKAGQAIMSTKSAPEAAQAVLSQFLRPAPEHQQSRSAQYGGQPKFDLATLAQIASDPYASEGQKAVVAALIQQQMQSADPMRQIELQKAQLELQQMQQPTAPKPYSSMGEIQADLKNGLITQEQAQIAVTKLGGGTSVTVNNGGGPGADEEALRTSLGKKEGESWSAYMDAGTVSAGTIQDMQLLDEIIKVAPQGPLSGRLAAAIPGVSSAADAFTSIVKRVAPTLRAVGSGATSDIEYDGMLKSLPQLSSKPEANAAISAMMKAKAQINIERSEVVRAFQNGELPLAEARKAISEIDKRSIMSPELKAMLQSLGEAPAGAAPEGVAQEEWDAMTPEDRALWQN